VPKNHLNQNFWSLSIEEIHVNLGNVIKDPFTEKTNVEESVTTFDNESNAYFPVNKNLRAILSLNCSVIMLPSGYINQMIKSFEEMGINCYMKEMHFKCNNFVNTT